MAKREHFYDAASGTGYLAWCLKTVQRRVLQRSVKNSPGVFQGGPSLKRTTTEEQQPDGDTVREAISLLSHSSDHFLIRSKMRETFYHRHELVQNPEMTTEVLKTYLRFLDVKGLMNQDFTLLFGSETSSKLLEKWDCTVYHWEKLSLNKSKFGPIQEFSDEVDITQYLRQGCPILSRNGRCGCWFLLEPNTNTPDSTHQGLD
ncbi:hypothetical protein GJAV_G00077430 [Gymnothorax javanicus]|nr:hypothetical protein GJAV_G00077430 [Gymnothorax javanicus]